MKLKYKIISTQIGLILGHIICYTLLNSSLTSLIITHFTLSVGYLYGLWHRNK